MVVLPFVVRPAQRLAVVRVQVSTGSAGPEDDLVDVERFAGGVPARHLGDDVAGDTAAVAGEDLSADLVALVALSGASW